MGRSDEADSGTEVDGSREWGGLREEGGEGLSPPVKGTGPTGVALGAALTTHSADVVCAERRQGHDPLRLGRVALTPPHPISHFHAHMHTLPHRREALSRKMVCNLWIPKFVTFY